MWWGRLVTSVEVRGLCLPRCHAAMTEFVPFQQHEELTTRIANILRDYAPGPSVLREFVQNADDARARRFALCLDLRTHSVSPSKTTRHAPDGDHDGLLTPALAAYQGPALLVYNDAPFSDCDFESIVRVGASGKAADATTIGKYGLGFNVAYHFTDVVSFVSRDQVPPRLLGAAWFDRPRAQSGRDGGRERHTPPHAACTRSHRRQRSLLLIF